MTKKKIDRKIIELIERSIYSRHRCMFFICGTKARDQVMFLHHLLLKCRKAAQLEKPSILWCFKKEAGLNGHHQKKRLKHLRKKYSGNKILCEEDAFDHFLLSSRPHFCHYSETDRVLGRTFGMLIVQNFEALTPNTLARITECTEGGGMILFLLSDDLQHLFDLKMDAHARYVTQAYGNVTALFNRRLVLSLANCTGCLVLDDRLKVRQQPDLRPDHFDMATATNFPDIERVLPDSLTTDQERRIFSLCRTNDQLAALQCLHKALDGPAIVSLTSGRGRGKSAVMGLAVAIAIASGLANVLVTSPHAENLQALFEFVAKGFDVIDWVEGKDYQMVRNDCSLVTSVCVLHGHKKKQVEFRLPVEHGAAGGYADLVVVDEAAAIPLPLVRKWMLPNCAVFMASTIQGYEGTGRSLSLKLLNQLRNPDNRCPSGDQGHILHEVQLNEAIRYSNGDPIEAWLSSLLCLEASVGTDFDRALPVDQKCQLYHVNREALFGYSPGAEAFLQRLVSLFVSSHYKNSPNDLMMMADAPAHRLFCLVEEGAPHMPLCAIQVSLEGRISSVSNHLEQAYGRRASGDLIPWVISQQFQDKDFPLLSSARIVRIATHPDCQRMGYGRRALQLLSDFYSASKKSCPITSKNELLSRLEEVQPEQPLDYLGVSYGLTTDLLKFWTKAGFVPLYIRQTASEVTGEHSCVMVKGPHRGHSWLPDFSSDFQVRFASLLPTSFRHLPSSAAMQVLQAGSATPKPLSSDHLRLLVAPRNLLRLDAYCRSEVDYHLVMDLLPSLAPLHLLRRLGGTPLPQLQERVLVCVGLQNKSAEETAAELCMEPFQVMGLFRKTLKKILETLNQKAICDKRKSSAVESHQKTEGKRQNEEILHNKPKKFKRIRQSPSWKDSNQS